MTCVLTLFGEMDLQNILKKKFQANDIFFIEDNCTTSVQLTTQVEARCKEVDAVIIYSAAMNMDFIREYVEELRVYTENLRVILILKGDKNSFLRSQLNEYWDLKLDLIFDADGFDTDELVQLLRKGKLSNKEFRTRKGIGFNGNIEDIPVPENFTDSPKEAKRALNFSEKKEHFGIADDFSNIKSYSEPQGHFAVGVFNAARGAGATWTANNLARYFAMHNYKTCIADMSSTGACNMMKLKNVDVYAEGFDIEELRSRYNVTIIDFGTPIEVSPKGDNFKLMSEYKPETIQCFTGCDIKLMLGFSAPWNIEKIKFFFINDTWREQFDNSYLFVVAGNPERVKKFYPEGNFFSRDDDYREYILEALRKEEDK